MDIGSHGLAYRLWPRVVEHVGVNVDSLALDLVRPTTVIPYAADSRSNISLRHSDGLSVIQRLDGSKEVGVLLHQVCQPQEHDTPLLWWRRPPAALEGLSSRGDSDIDVILCGLTHGADSFLGGGVDDLDLLLVLALDPFIVDEPGESQLVNEVRVSVAVSRSLQSDGLLVGAGDWRVKLCEQRHIARLWMDCWGVV